MRSANRTICKWDKARAGKVLIGLSSIMLALSGAKSSPMETSAVGAVAGAAPAGTPANGISGSDAARATIVAFARCTVQGHRKVVENILAIPPLDKRSDYALGKLVDSDCLQSGDLHIPHSLIRGGLYAALYMADYDSEPVALIATPLDFASDVRGASTPEAQQYIWLHQFADCVVRADTVDSRALVLAGAGTPAENAIFSSLVPHFNACLIKGQSLTFSKAVLSSLIAEVLYRETKGVAAAPSGG